MSINKNQNDPGGYPGSSNSNGNIIPFNSNNCNIIASPQADNGHLRIANELLEEIISRDFSKRQLKIIFFILRLSWACQKKYAVIPQMKDFELCGIGRQHITKELDLLEKARVIYWNRENGIFAVNKFYDYWIIPPVTKTVTATIKDLIKKQLEVTKTVTEKLTKLLKQESGVTKTVILWLLKQELNGSYNPDTEQEKTLPKESIKEKKENNKEKKKSQFTNDVINDIVMEVFEDIAFIPIVKEWLEYKQARKESYKNDKSIICMCKKLQKLSNNRPDKAKDLIEEAMANNWSGFHSNESKKQPSNNNFASGWNPTGGSVGNWNNRR